MSTEDSESSPVRDPADELPPDGLPNLAESARKRSLNSLRWILAFIGASTVAFNGFTYIEAESIADEAIEKQVEALEAKLLIVDKSTLPAAKAKIISVLRLVALAFIVTGIANLAMAWSLPLAPVVISVLALVLFLAGSAFLAVYEPDLFVSGIYLRIGVIVALFWGVRVAIIHQREASLA